VRFSRGNAFADVVLDGQCDAADGGQQKYHVGCPTEIVHGDHALRGRIASNRVHDHDGDGGDAQTDAEEPYVPLMSICLGMPRGPQEQQHRAAHHEKVR